MGVVKFDSSDSWANIALDREAQDILSRRGWNSGKERVQQLIERKRVVRRGLPALDDGPGFHSSEVAMAIEESSLDPDADHTHLRGALGAILRDSRPDLMAKYHPGIPVA